TIRPEGEASAPACRAQCTPHSTGTVPRSAKTVSSAPPHASPALLAMAHPPQAGVEAAGRPQRPQLGQALVPLPHQVIQPQVVAAVRLDQLCDPVPQAPLWLELRDLGADAVAGDPVVAGVRAGALG